ncbi:MAG: hypothetical protein GX275_04850 [Clostridiales bacterium]|nr:hypothetical protein [Clostridiales bacterium]
MSRDELKIKILKREEDRIFIEVVFEKRIYKGYIKFNEKALNKRIKGKKSKRKLVDNKLAERISKQIYKANNKEIGQVLTPSLKPYLSSAYANNIEFQIKMSEKLVGKKSNKLVHKNSVGNNRAILKLTESDPGDILPPIKA